MACYVVPFAHWSVVLMPPPPSLCPVSPFSCREYLREQDAELLGATVPIAKILL
jgi:hypothetical protein